MTKLRQMKYSILTIFFCFILINISHVVSGQTYAIGVIVKNQPENKIMLGLVKGDNVIATDSAFAENGLVRFNLTDDSRTGVYRIILGHTNPNDESPQYFDFIFNKEEIVLETDFDSPETSTRVIQSAENTIWYSFKKKELEFQKELIGLEKEVNYLWAKEKTDLAISKANEYNELQIKRDLYITQQIEEADLLFAGKMMKVFKEPILDGYLTKEQRNVMFQKYFLNSVDFSDEALIYSQVYTDKIFQYLLSYNKPTYTKSQREEAYKKAVDVILNVTNKNETVYEFVKEYLRYGFGVLNLENVNTYIEENFK